MMVILSDLQTNMVTANAMHKIRKDMVSREDVEKMKKTSTTTPKYV